LGLSKLLCLAAKPGLQSLKPQQAGGCDLVAWPYLHHELRTDKAELTATGLKQQSPAVKIAVH